MSALKFAEDHATRPGEAYQVPAAKPYILSFDTQDLVLVDAHEFDDGIPLLAFKGVLISTLDAFTQSYAEGVFEIAQACGEEAKRLPKEQQQKLPLDNQRTLGLIQAAQNRLDSAMTQIGNWDGSGRFSIILPYVAVAKREVKDMITKKEGYVIDVFESKPYVNGIIFEAHWEN